MKKHTSRQSSRKAPEGRAGQVSTAQVSTAQVSVTPRGADQKPAPASPASAPQLIKLGVDTHAGRYVFARMVDNQNAQPPQAMGPEAFLAYLQKQKALAGRVVMVYEAGPYGFSLYRQATALGVECLVCAPERLSRGRKRVNDNIDARELLSRLDRHLSGNTTALRLNATALRLVRPPTLEQEMSRRAARERNTYRKERQRWIGRGRSLLHSLGVARPGRWWECGRNLELRQQIEQRYGQDVAIRAWAELDRYLQLIELATKKKDELTAELEKAAAERKTQRVRGVGLLSAELLDREVGDWNRFSNRRQVASYTGLCPGEDSSGDSRTSLSIDKHGNPRIRATLVELAWLLPRYQPDYKPLARWKAVFDPAGKAPSAQRKKAVVALARRLAVDLWRIRTGRARPQDLGLQLAA